tara:strand:- start:965 stop:1171 length:207 start_codon:yes stop_codon:yes gene_type:complete
MIAPNHGLHPGIESTRELLSVLVRSEKLLPAVRGGCFVIKALMKSRQTTKSRISVANEERTFSAFDEK